MNPKLSVIIPAYNEEKDIGKCLQSLKNQSYTPFEIIVIDDGSTDRTAEIINKIGNARLIKGEHKGTGFSRNLGAEKSTGEILIFVDADMTFDKDFLKYLVKPIIDEDVIGTLEEKQLITNLDIPWSRCLGKVIVDSSTRGGTVCRAIKRKKFFEMGGFDPSYGYADDQTFWIKFKVRSVTAIGAVCYHKNPGTLNAVYKQARWSGASLAYNFPILNIPVLNATLALSGYLASPLVYPSITLYRLLKKKDYGLFFYYWPFMFVKYFGTLRGILNYALLNKNVR